MGCFKWANAQIKKLDWADISLIKLCVAAFILMIAKLWSPILVLKWYWYLIIGVVLAIRPFIKIFKK